MHEFLTKIFLRHIVSKLPGSTRDAIETFFLTPNGYFFILMDTAGIGKKSSYINFKKKYIEIFNLNFLKLNHLLKIYVFL